MTMISIIPEESTSKTGQTSNTGYQTTLVYSGNQPAPEQVEVSKRQTTRETVMFPADRVYIGYKGTLVSEKPNLWDDFFASAPLPDDFMEE